MNNLVVSAKIVLKVNYDKNVHYNELKIMKHLQKEQIPGVSKMIDYGQIKDSSYRLSVQESRKYYFLAM